MPPGGSPDARPSVRGRPLPSWVSGSLGIRGRLTISYLLSFTALFLTLGLFLTVAFRDAMVSTAQDTLELAARAIVRQASQPGDESDLAQLLAVTGVVGDTGQPEVIGQILSRDGRVVQGSGPDAPATPIVSGGELATALADGHWHGAVTLAGRSHDDIVLAVPIGNAAGQFLVLAQTLGPAEQATGRLTTLLLVATPVGFVLAGLGGWLLARAALRPVDAMTRTAAAITAEGAPRELPVPLHRDELHRLATTLNAMLERLGRSLAEERRFTADASHELRTPIALMETEIDVALRSAETPAEARPVLASVREEAERLRRIVENLLVLARIDAAGRVELMFAEEDLEAVVGTVVARYAVSASQRQVGLTFGGSPVAVLVDRELLGQAVSNLLDNALKFTPPGGSIDVRVEAAPQPTIRVRDTGIGIAPAAVPHIFDRFFRVDGARQRQAGAGLGLEISRRIVEAHEGSIEVQSVEGLGTTFTVRLPAAPAAAAGPEMVTGISPA